MLERGTWYAQEVYEREIRIKKSVKPQEGPRRFSGAENIERIISKIDINTQRDVEKRISEQYATMLTTLAEQMKTGKTSDGKDISKAMLPELEKSLKIMKEDKVAEENKKTLTMNVFGAAISQIEGSEGVGVAANLTSEKLNAKLSNEKAWWINSINLTTWVFSPFSDMKNLAIGTALTFTGSKTRNWANEKRDNLKNGWEHRLLYAAGVWAWIGLQNGKLLVGPSVGVWYEEQINAKAMSKTLDAKSAKYLGGMAHATLASRGVDGYYRADKVTGIIEQQAHIESEFAGIINTALLGKGATSFSFESVQKNLAGKFPGTHKDTIYAAAQNIMSMIRPYKAVFDSPDNKDAAAKNAVIKAIARDYALLWRNQHMEDLNGKFALTGVGGGVEFIAFVLPIPHVGLQFTKYKGLAYSEMQESLSRAHDIIANARWVDDDNRLGASILDRLPQLNAIFNDGKKSAPATENTEAVTNTEYFKKDATGNLVIDPTVIGKKGLNIHILPELKQFVKTGANGELIVPASMPMMLRSTYRAKKYEYDFVIGSVWTLKTESVNKFDGFVWAPEKYEWAEVTKDVIDARLKANKGGEKILEYVTITEVEKWKAGFVHFSLEKAKAIFGANLKVSPKIWRSDKKLADGKTERVYDLPKNGFLRMQENQTADGKKELLVDVQQSTRWLQFGYELKKIEKIEAAPVVATGMLDGVTWSALEWDGPNSTLPKEFIALMKDNNAFLKLKGDKTNKSLIALLSSDENPKDPDAKWNKAYGLARKLYWVNAFPENYDKRQLLRILEAKLCVSTKTADKDLNIFGDKEKAKAHAKNYYAQCDAATQKKIDEISKWLWGIDKLIADIIDCKDKCSTQADYKTAILAIRDLSKDSMNPARRLWWMLAPLSEVVWVRKNVLEGIMKKAKLPVEAQTGIMTSRDALVNTMDGQCVYKGQTLPNSIGLVMGMGWTLTEKFVPRPRIAVDANASDPAQALEHSKYSIDNNQALKKYFLTNLLKQDSMILQDVLKCEALKDIKWLTPKGLVDALLSADGKLPNGKKVTANFSFAFYNECFNDTIIMEGLTVEGWEPKKEEKPGKDVKLDEQTADVTISADNGFYLDNYATVSKATVKQRNYAILVAFWGKRQAWTPQSEIPGEGISIPVEGPDGQSWTLNIHC
jgi:hypothetical protein